MSIQLNLEQEEIYNKLIEKIDKFNVSLIDGVTGSGKTLIFLKVINFLLNQVQLSFAKTKISPICSKLDGVQILIMIPEISLTESLIEKIKTLCSIEPIVWHSSISAKKKKEIFNKILANETNIILGARSALFLPYKNLKLIIVDEEHDSSYKQNEYPVYNAKNTAITIAKYKNIPIILFSATPSLESYYNAINKKYDYYQLTSKFYKTSHPNIKLIDISKSFKKNINQTEFNDHIIEEVKISIKNAVLNNEQVAIFINRRGFARTLICNDCKADFKCKNCNNLLSYHQKIFLLKCHFCNFKQQVPKKCIKCNSENFISFGGAGVEKINQEIQEYFKLTLPEKEIKTLIFSSDEIKSTKDLQESIYKIVNHEINIIIGTQILTKGHHFPHLQLIVILDIDSIASDGDFRCFEKSFQLLTQLCGRAGRENEGSNVLIQTINPNNIVLQSIQKYAKDEFYKNELEQRKIANLPPFSMLIAIIISSEKQELASNFSKEFAKAFHDYILENKINNIKFLGPAESFIHFLKRHFHYRFLIRCKKDMEFISKLKFFIDNKIKIPAKIQLKIDVDPVNFI